MGEWMEDTMEGVTFLASTMERARAAPNLVMKEIHAYALGMADETGQLMRDMAKKGREDRAVGLAGDGTPPRAAIPTPPSCNTGGKVPQNTNNKNKRTK